MNEVEEELASVKGELHRVNGMIDIKQSQIDDQNNRLGDLETKVSKPNKDKLIFLFDKYGPWALKLFFSGINIKYLEIFLEEFDLFFPCFLISERRPPTRKDRNEKKTRGWAWWKVSVTIQICDMPSCTLPLDILQPVFQRIFF